MECLTVEPRITEVTTLLQAPTSWSLVFGTAAAIPADREEFSRRYGPMVRSCLAMRWAVPETDPRVDDGTQDVFLRIFSPNGPLSRVERRRPNGFRAYLRGVVRIVACELERRDYSRREFSGRDLDVEQAAAEEAFAGAFDRSWAEMIIDEAWEVLRARAREEPLQRQRLQVFKLRYAEGLPPRSIARRLGIGVRQIYRMLEAGRSQFRLAMMLAVSNYYTAMSPSELEARCREIVEHL